MNKLFITTLAILSLLLVGCTQPIADIKNDDYIGENVKVRGTVTGVLSIGSISGYTITDEAGDDIAVATQDLPQKGDVVTAKGVLRKQLFYYIEAEE